MLNKLIDILEFPGTPIVSVVLMGIMDSILRTTGADALHFLVCLILTVVAVISTLMNLSFYGPKMKIVTLGICLFSVLFLFSEFDSSGTGETGNTNITYHTTGGYQPISFNGNKKNTNNSIFDKDCNFCNDSQKCHVCKGKGGSYCNGSYCLRGQCTSCKGTGLYDHGSYVSKCLTCKGDGICNICDGTSRRDCTTCRGSGRCTHCK